MACVSICHKRFVIFGFKLRRVPHRFVSPFACFYCSTGKPPHRKQVCWCVGVGVGVGVIVLCMWQYGAFGISGVFGMLYALVHVFVWAHENAHVAYARARWSMCACV